VCVSAAKLRKNASNSRVPAWAGLCRSSVYVCALRQEINLVFRSCGGDLRPARKRLRILYSVLGLAGGDLQLQLQSGLDDSAVPPFLSLTFSRVVFLPQRPPSWWLRFITHQPRAHDRRPSAPAGRGTCSVARTAPVGSFLVGDLVNRQPLPVQPIAIARAILVPSLSPTTRLLPRFLSHNEYYTSRVQDLS
jgi:hypothetical protein